MQVSLVWQRMGRGVLPRPWWLPLAAPWGVMGVQDVSPTPTHTRSSHPRYGVRHTVPASFSLT